MVCHRLQEVRMNRFYVEPCQIAGDTAVITGDDVAHISKVLRLKAGDEIALCDGQCHEWTAKITALDKKQAELSLGEKTVLNTEPRCRITIYQGIQKAGKFETVIQKGVELGACAFVPFDCERAVARPWKADDSKQERYERVAYEAAKQCRRGIVPKVEAPIDFKKLCARAAEHELTILFWEEEKVRSLKALLREKTGCTDIAMIIGPEGGISPAEAAALSAAGAQTASLGTRILRTETAGPAATAMILYEQDDMNP